MRKISFVACTAGAKEPTPLYRSFQKLKIQDYQFIEHNQRGLSECYNQWLDRYAGDDRILVLAHSDVLLADAFFDEKLSHAANAFNIIGLVGTSQFNIHLDAPDYGWPKWPPAHLSGSVEHVDGNGISDWFRLGPTPKRCVAMDGLFLAADMRTIGAVRFDPQFTFHLYDLDFCLTAHLAKLSMGTTNIYVQHASPGDFASAAYQAARQRFRAKWTAIMQSRTGT